MWTSEDLNYLTTNYPTEMPVVDICAYLNKSKSAIATKAARLGLKRPDNVFDNLDKKSWSTEEINLLKTSYRNTSDAEALAIKLNRSISSVKNKALNLGIITEVHSRRVSWTQEDQDYLIANYPFKSRDQLALEMGFSGTKISKKVKELGLRKSQSHWTKPEQDMLMSMFGKMSYTELSKVLNRSKDGVERKASDLGLAKVRNEYTEPELLVKNCLDKLGIAYESQKKLFTGSRYSDGRREHLKPDFVINQKLIIEVQGDYWHCNPRKYPNGPQDNIQEECVARDAKKLSWYASNGYEVLLIWQDELVDTKKLEQTILDFVPS